MKISDRLGHLTYSTLVHPGDTWPEMRDSVSTFVPAVKKRVSPDAPMGLSLRLSGASVAALQADEAERADFLAYLRAQDLYVYTINAFPHGPFKGRSVMEQVYEPDWATEERMRYTMGVADVLVDITEADVEPSIQTAPLAFKPKVEGPSYVEGFTTNLLRVVAHLVDLERRTGRRIKLSLEPEPYCFLETTDETVRYFEDRLYSRAGAEELAALASCPVSEAIGLIRRHLGVVFDIGHQSVEFEDIPAALGSLVAAGIPIFKLQEAAALWVPEVTDEAVNALEKFTDTIYLSQTTERRDGELTRFLNLGDAIAAWKEKPGGAREWRTHFHVPVFLDEIGGFRTTRVNIEAALELHRRTPLSDHLEIETYTRDVLPEELKTGDITEYVSREIEWVRDVLTSGAPADAR
ncbi:MAG TPA: metabolite traffic protein EboE [Intrasporangium sp.]|uniref:metabolite traffic protein EboE n=1 Tax=Intrasporangium sp. TaxID=1925024 RepID=UPI002D781312|nr:metabolite traffic protein EboE [Intrasporangium sp.]HET7399077.1 metabolite traffic protein EboE [Intrasporangium sp.]